jgi:hypothetical protein|tara:strand:- start:427 stop:645 length:219 start_codon:yes stop_codon:yes gene_type:complete
MSDVSAISPISVVSSYTRLSAVGPHEVVTHINHNQQDGGPIKVSEVSYTTYNARGEIVPDHNPPGSNLDVIT